MLTTVSGVNLKHYGVTLTAFVYAVMLGKSFGYNLFLYLWFFMKFTLKNNNLICSFDYEKASVLREIGKQVSTY